MLLVGVIGPLSLAASAISDGIFARNQITANYLAQEAVEVVINKRYALARRAQYIPPTSGETIFSTGYIIPEDSSNQFASCVAVSASPNTYCTVNPQSGAIVSSPSCAGPDYAECKLVYNNVSHLYQKPTSSAAGDAGPVFTRKLKIVAVNSNEVKVTVQVDWNNKATPKSLILVEHLFSQG